MKIQQELPREQVAIIFKALKLYRTVVDITPQCDNQEVDYLKFDIVTLKAMLTGKVIFEFTESQLDSFTQTNGVDFPNYTDEDKLRLKKEKEKEDLLTRNRLGNFVSMDLDEAFKIWESLDCTHDNDMADDHFTMWQPLEDSLTISQLADSL